MNSLHKPATQAILLRQAGQPHAITRAIIGQIKESSSRMGKGGSIAVLVAAQVAVLSLWFVSAAILPAMQSELPMSGFRQAALSSAVQAGFVIGALASALSGLADRFDPRSRRDLRPSRQGCAGRRGDRGLRPSREHSRRTRPANR